MEKGLEVYLDDPAICTGDFGGGLMGMHDCSKEWFCFEPLRRIIARTMSKVLTGRGWGRGRGQDRLNQPINQTNDWPTNWTTDQPTHRPIKVAHNCIADPTNDCSVKPRTIENSYTKEPIGKTIHTSKQLRTINQPSDRNQATHPRGIGLQQIKASNSSDSGRIVISWSDNWPNNWPNMSTSASTPLEVEIGQRFGSWARGLEPARGQEPITEALKIQEVQKVDIRR